MQKRAVFWIFWEQLGQAGVENGAMLTTYLFKYTLCIKPSVLWRCWLGGRKGIRPVKNWAVRSWCGICLEQGADLHMAQLMPSPLTVSCFSKIQIGFSFLVLAHPGSPGQRAIKRVCVYTLHQNAPFRSQIVTIFSSPQAARGHWPPSPPNQNHADFTEQW